MLERNLKVGDLVIWDRGILVTILLKQTKKYWYYYMDGHGTARIKKEKLWPLIDTYTKGVEIKPGSNMKNRKKQPKWRVLDLHGVRHAAVSDRVRDYLNWVELPTRIITGNSSRMREIVQEVVQEYGWSCRESIDNSGHLIIEERLDSK